MSLRSWIAATRPKTLPAALAPVAVGGALGATIVSLSWPHLLGCLLAAVLVQIATNFANDALDARAGADSPDRIGPTRAVATGAISFRAMVLATLAVLLLAGAVGFWLGLRGGWPIWILGLCSLLCAWAYTGGPLPLAYHGLGEVFVLIFFGWVAVLGTAWIQVAPIVTDPALIDDAVLLGLPWAWWALATATGLQASAILAVNNLRDRTSDAAAGKRTLAVRLGDRAYRVLYACLLGGAAACLATAAWLTQALWLYLPAAVALLGGRQAARRVALLPAESLNPWLGRTAALELLTAACVVLALWLELR